MKVSTSSNIVESPLLHVQVQKRIMNVKCLLLCPEGTFPYLTPSLVEQCFPYKTVGDYLYLGISVNDTCLVPVYPNNNVNNNTTTDKENNVHDNDNNTNTKVVDAINENENETDEIKPTTTTTIIVEQQQQSRQERKKLEKQVRNNRKRQRKLIEVNKPIGYEFSSSSIQIDSWIVPYTRITVPSFDLVSDTISRGASSSSVGVVVSGGGGVGGIVSTSVCNSNSNNPITTTTTTTAAPSDRSLQLWTSNGRHSITPEQYVSVATGLQSHITIPLYDELFVESNKTDTLSSSSSTPINQLINRTQQKRMELILQNNKLWIERHIKLLQERSEQSMTDYSIGQQVVTSRINHKTMTENNIWLPITLTNHSDITSINEYMEWLQQYFVHVPKEVNQNCIVSGCSIFGWQHITDSIQQQQLQKQSLQCIFQGMKNMFHATRINSDSNSNNENHAVECHDHDSDNDNDNNNHQKRSPITVAIMSVLSLKQLLLILDTVANVLLVDNNNDSNICIDLVIGTKLPMIWARSKKAFVCPFHDDNIMNDLSICPVVNNESSISAASTNSNNNSSISNVPFELLVDDDGCIDLSQYAKGDNDDISNFSWFNDSRPIMNGCTCLTCQTHSRSYIYHLICAQELLGEILLFIHNLHHFLHLINTVNKIVLLQQTTNDLTKVNNNDNTSTNNNRIGTTGCSNSNTKKRQHEESEMITLYSFLESIQSTLNKHSPNKS